jgi:hypothetical protein
MKIYERKQKAPYIPSASFNLLGLCIIIFAFLKFLKLSQPTSINKTDVIVFFLFMLSCVVSFLSIRGSIKRDALFEWIADLLLFIGAMQVVIFLAILIALSVHN